MLRRYAVFLLAAAAMLCAAVVALWFGSAELRLSEVFAGLFSDGDAKLSVIIRHIRLPRMLAAFLAGIGLSVSGVLLQAVTDNGLASPNIIGVNSGAGFLTILTLFCFPHAFYALPFAAFFGAFAATLLIVWTANRIGSSKMTIILAGMALTAILNAGISFISLLDTDVVAVYNYFSVGGLSGVTAKSLIIPAALIFLSLGAALLLSPKISLLCLGDSLASSLGVRVRLLRMVCLICASASAAAVVSFAGLYCAAYRKEAVRRRDDQNARFGFDGWSNGCHAGGYTWTDAVCTDGNTGWDCDGTDRRAVFSGTLA